MAKFSPYAVTGDLSVADVVWTGGFWGDRFDACRKSMIPAMWDILSNDGLSHAFANFRIAAGMEKGEHSGPPFFDGDLYKWLEAVASVYATARDPVLDALMDTVIAVIARAQRADGYLHTPVIIAERNRAPDAAPAALGDRLHFEVYNFGHLMTTACRHKEATGKDSLLDVARRAADYLEARFSVPDPQTAKNNICPAHYMGLIELFRLTGEARYRDFAAALMDNRNLIKDGTDDNQDRIPFRDQRRAVGHAVRANYLYAGAADLYAETGDATLMPALLALWDNVAHTKTYITGATGALYDGVSPDGDEDHWSIQRIHQAYGREYQLPNTTAYNETCANIGNALWNWRMFRITGEAKYADVVETVLYNSVLSGISLDGRKYFYQNTLREELKMPVPLRWPRRRAPYISSFCCPPNTVRTIAQTGAMAYALAKDGVKVVLYGSNRLSTVLPDGSRLALAQESAYPWDGKVRISVAEAPRGAYAVSLRIPAWARGALVRVNGIAVERPCVPGTFFDIRREWKAGDTIDLELPMRPRMVLAHSLVEESRNQAAVMRGPVVYCVESDDLPEGIAMKDVLLPAGSEFRVEKGRGPLEGIPMLRAKAYRLALSDDAELLYRDLEAWKTEEIDVTLVPYYAWDNRSAGEMSVWLPLAWK